MAVGCLGGDWDRCPGCFCWMGTTPKSNYRNPSPLSFLPPCRGAAAQIFHGLLRIEARGPNLTHTDAKTHKVNTHTHTVKAKYPRGMVLALRYEHKRSSDQYGMNCVYPTQAGESVCGGAGVFAVPKRCAGSCLMASINTLPVLLFLLSFINASSPLLRLVFHRSSCVFTKVLSDLS